MSDDLERSPGDYQWWLAPEGQKHEGVLRVARHIRENQEYRRFNDLLNASMYTGRPMTSVGVGAAASTMARAMERLSLNVIQNMIGSVCSKIAAKNKAKPTFLTEDGNWEQQQEAQKLEKFTGGVFYESGVYVELTDVFRDALIWGTGFLKVYENERRVEVDRVSPLEILVDDDEGREGKPANMYQEKFIDRGVLRAMYADDPDKVRAIDVCPVDPADRDYGHRTTSDRIRVTEAWHLGETKKKAGRRALVIEGCTLEDEEWKGPFPFAVMRWRKDVEGFFGVGLAEDLRGVQGEINKLLRRIQKAHHLITGHWLVQQGAMVVGQLNNDIGAVVRFTGTPPDYKAPSPIAPDVYNHLWQLYQKAYEVSGISQLNASGMKPAGLDSGEAQRVYQDIQTERFLEVGQAYEELVVEAARQVIRCASRIGDGYAVKAVDKSDYETIDWSDINIDIESCVIRVFPTSLLPTTPAGKIQWAEDRAKAGLIPPDELIDLLDFPDTMAYAKRKLAVRRSIERRLGKMVKSNEAATPEPFDDLEACITIGRDFYHECVNSGVPEDRLELIRTWIANAQEMLPPPPEPAPPPDPMGMPPMGPPGPPGMPPPGMPPGPPPPMGPPPEMPPMPAAA